MSLGTVQAVSYLGPEGWGNDRLGLRSWPSETAAALESGDLERLHWSSLFSTDPSRFGRMDGLSRLGLMAVELLDAGFGDLDPARRDAMGVCVETRSGSLATDVRFLRLATAGTFAYTLPSTVLGEVCIRYRFRGPVLCLQPGGSDQGEALEVALGWLKRGEAEACVCIGCELPDKEVAARLALPEHARLGDWHGCAVLVGRQTRESGGPLWPCGSLSSLARARCWERAEASRAGRGGRKSYGISDGRTESEDHQRVEPGRDDAGRHQG